MTKNQVPTRTDREYWEEYWHSRRQNGPPELTIDTNKYSRGLYSVFHRFLPSGEALSIVEIGGAPGIFISSLTKINSQLRLGIIDYSDQGIAETKKVSGELGLDIQIHQKDIYSCDLSDIPKYDVAYSLGVVEHYEDIELSVNKHLACIKDGGLLIVGLPVFLGVNEWLVDRLAPKNKTTWYPMVMDNRSWKKLYDRPDLQILADEYVGGFNPHVHHRLEDKTSLLKKIGYVLLHRYFARIWDVLPATDQLNSRYCSFFYYFVARKQPLEAKPA